MKKTLPVLLILVVVAVGLFLFFANRGPAGPALAFELKFKPGQIDKYKVGMDIVADMPNMPKGPGTAVPTKMNMNMSADMAQKVLSVNPDGSAKVKYTFSNMKVTTPFGPPSASKETSDFTADIAKNGSILKVDGVGSSGLPTNADQLKTVNQMMAIAIPKTPMQVGASWNNHFEIPVIGESIDVDSTFAKDNEPVGKCKAAVINSQVNYKGDIGEIAKKAGKKSGMPTPPDVKGTIAANGTGACYFDRSAGKIVKANANAKIIMDAEVPQAMAGPGMPNKQHVEITLTMHMNKVD